MANHKNRLAKLETNQAAAQPRPTWRELMEADADEWQQIRRDNPDLATWWDETMTAQQVAHEQH